MWTQRLPYSLDAKRKGAGGLAFTGPQAKIMQRPHYLRTKSAHPWTLDKGVEAKVGLPH